MSILKNVDLSLPTTKYHFSSLSFLSLSLSFPIFARFFEVNSERIPDCSKLPEDWNIFDISPERRGRATFPGGPFGVFNLGLRETVALTEWWDSWTCFQASSNGQKKSQEKGHYRHLSTEPTTKDSRPKQEGAWQVTTGEIHPLHLTACITVMELGIL